MAPCLPTHRGNEQACIYDPDCSSVFLSFKLNCFALTMELSIRYDDKTHQGLTIGNSKTLGCKEIRRSSFNKLVENSF